MVFYSPLQTIFWYDRPAFYHGEPEIEWFEHLPTVWDDSRVLDGTPGQHITLARRKGDEWYVGLMTGNEGRMATLSLSFLPEGQRYLLSAYTDGGDKVATATHVACTYGWVDAGTVLHFPLQPSGGAALRLTPLSPKDAKRYAKFRLPNR